MAGATPAAEGALRFAQGLPDAAPQNLPFHGVSSALYVTPSIFAGCIGIAIMAPEETSPSVVADNPLALALVDGQGRTLTLGAFDGDEIVARWRSFAQTSGLRLMIGLPGDTFLTIGDQIGRLHLGATRTRRTSSCLKHRRSRFLQKRQTSYLDERPVIYR